MCEMCELALARGEEAPAFYTLPVHPDYLRKPEPKFVATEVAVEEDRSENAIAQHRSLPSSGATRHLLP